VKNFLMRDHSARAVSTRWGTSKRPGSGSASGFVGTTNVTDLWTLHVRSIQSFSGTGSGERHMLGSAVTAAQFLALAQVGGTVSRVAWGVTSDRSFGGRRRPGVVASAAIGAVAYATLALGTRLPVWLMIPLALVAGAGAFGWVGLYFALVAEIGGPRYAGLLTGAATACSWSGTLIGPPIFGVMLEATGDYTLPWLILTAIALAVAVTLPRLSPLVQRG